MKYEIEVKKVYTTGLVVEADNWDEATNNAIDMMTGVDIDQYDLDEMTFTNVTNKDSLNYYAEIEEVYAKESDTTFVIKNEYLEGDLFRREVISFYAGEPNKGDTMYYLKNPSVVAHYEM